MKALNISLSLVLVLGLSLVLSAQDAGNQSLSKEDNIKSMVAAHRYVFKAQTVLPSRGRTIQLNSDYDLRVAGDTLRSYLPYFGRAYSAPIGSRGGGYDFISNEFEYVQQDRRKGGWNIVIRPKDNNDVREMYLTVLENGSATLRIVSNNREPIAYNGFLETN